jgi:hypothetical protein
MLPRVKSVALFNRRLLVNFRYAPLATEIARHCNMSRRAQAVWANSRRLLTGARDHERLHGASASSKILASLKSGVSKPSVNQP